MEEYVQQIAWDLEKIREKKPLIHHITNFVVMNETANITLCLGALPIMSHAKEEVEEMVQMSNALILNIGTLDSQWIQSMFLAGKAANKSGIPVILDPVGAGATKLRTKTAIDLLNEIEIAVIRGNAAEISSITGHQVEIRGVESTGYVEKPEIIARELAEKEGTIVAVTGKEDVITDGNRVVKVNNGHPMLSMLTGTGCMASTIISGFCAVNKDYFQAALGALVIFGLAGEKACVFGEGRLGTFHVALYDCLAEMTEETIFKGHRIEMVA